jgi:5'-deoxynucleotidase YfbR-like HD superfamily hydrolase
MATRTLRYHTWPMLKEQTVGEHSCRVALIYLQLFGLPRAEVLEYILKHDLGELGAGDVPFYSKRRVPALKEASNAAEALGLEDLGLKLPELSKEEWFQFKVADLCEMYERGKIEYRMGNQYGDIVSRNIIEALSSLVTQEVLAGYLNKLWPEVVT